MDMPLKREVRNLIRPSQTSEDSSSKTNAHGPPWRRRPLARQRGTSAHTFGNVSTDTHLRWVTVWRPRLVAVWLGVHDMSDWRERIVSDPDILRGKPTVRGTRLSVELIVGWLAQGWTHEMLLESYPQLGRDDILAALAYTTVLLREESYLTIHPQAAAPTSRFQ
jgi:uncharacterized protein (DUF433 family)